MQLLLTRIDIEHDSNFHIKFCFESDILVEFFRKLENCIFKESNTVIYFMLLITEIFFIEKYFLC